MHEMKYFLSEEVALHNKKEDFWVIINQSVLNLTMLIRDRQDDWNKNMDHLLKFGGHDISDYFYDNGYPKLEIDDVTHEAKPIFAPVIEEANHPRLKSPGLLWCHDPMYHIGNLTRRRRRLRIVSTLDWKVMVMTVCDEDTVADIQRKYYEKAGLPDGTVFIWRKLSNMSKLPVELRWNRTLDENGLIDIDEIVDYPIPTLYLYPAQYAF